MSPGDQTDSGRPPGENGDLAGASIVVTRPAERGESLCREITAAGGDALLFPTLEIQPLAEPDLPADAGDFDWLVFTSVPSVAHGVALLDSVIPDWRQANIAAIGAATAEALQAAGIGNVTQPEAGREESEGLLSNRDFSVAHGNKVLIVRGEGGRRALDTGLQERGAAVHTMAVYRRVTASTDPAPLLARWKAGRVDAIVISSADGLRALHDMLDAQGRKHLRNSQLVLPTARMIKLSQELQVQPEPVIAAGASNAAVVAALTAWWNSTRKPG